MPRRSVDPRRMPAAALVFLLVAAGLPGLALAESSSDDESDHTIVTDRPDVSESSTTVPTNRLQLELGTSLTLGTRSPELADAAGDTDTAYPRVDTVQPVGVLARYGISETAEVRLSTSPLSLGFPPGRDARATAFPTVGVGAKVAGAINERFRVGVLPWAEIGRSFESNSLFWTAGVLGTAAYDLTPFFSSAANLGVGRSPGLLGGQMVEVRASLANAFSLSDVLTTYGEFYASFYPGALGEPLAQAALFGTDVGVTYLVTPTFQLDVYADTDLPDMRRLRVGLGASFLL